MQCNKQELSSTNLPHNQSDLSHLHFDNTGQQSTQNLISYTNFLSAEKEGSFKPVMVV